MQGGNLTMWDWHVLVMFRNVKFGLKISGASMAVTIDLAKEDTHMFEKKDAMLFGS